MARMPEYSIRVSSMAKHGMSKVGCKIVTLPKLLCRINPYASDFKSPKILLAGRLGILNLSRNKVHLGLL